MGCCCPKEKQEGDVDERTGLLAGSSSHDAAANPKSCFLDQPSSSQLGGGGGPSGSNTGGMGGGNGSYYHPNGGNGLLNDSNLLNDSSLMNNGGGNGFNNGMNGNGSGSNAAANMQTNHMFEKILSEVIHVSAYSGDQRGALNGGGGYNDLMSNISNPPVQDMPFKLKEPQFDQQQQLQLPEGVTAPLATLAAQPPFSSDIRLINILAAEASSCINNFSLNVPENVAFDFKPVV